MIVNVASWLNLGRNKKQANYVSIGSLDKIIEPNRTEIEEIESFFTHELIKIPIQVHIQKIYKNYFLTERIVNVRDTRLPVKDVFLYNEVSYQRSPFKLINTEKSIEHDNPWVKVFEKSDFIRQIEKNNDYLNRIEFIKNNL